MEAAWQDVEQEPTDELVCGERHNLLRSAPGVGAIAVAGLWMVLFPQLRKVRHLNGRN